MNSDNRSIPSLDTTSPDHDHTHCRHQKVFLMKTAPLHLVSVGRAASPLKKTVVETLLLFDELVWIGRH